MPARKTRTELARVGRGPGRDSGGRVIGASRTPDEPDEALAEYEALVSVPDGLDGNVSDGTLDFMEAAESALRKAGIADRQLSKLYRIAKGVRQSEQGR